MIEHYLPIGSALAAFAILTGTMFITSQVPVYVRVGASALAVVFAIMIWLNATALLGYPVAAYPKQGTVISMLPDKPHGLLYVWVLESSGLRAYQIPYESGEAGELMEAGRKAKETGGVVRIRPKGKDGDGGEGRQGNGRQGTGQNRGHGHGGGNSDLQGDDTLDVDIDVVPLLPEKD